MTVMVKINKTRVNGDGTVEDFTFDFPVHNATDLVVKKIVNATEVATLQVLNTDYTVILNTVTEGGTVSYTVAPLATEDSFIKRILELDQGTIIPTESNFPEITIENEIDRSRMIDIQINEEIIRAIQLPETSLLTNIAAPVGTSATDRKVKIWGWDSVGTGLALYNPTIIDAVSVIAVKGDIVQGSDAGAAEKLPIGGTGAIPHVLSTGKLDYLELGNKGDLLRVGGSGAIIYEALSHTKNLLRNGDFSLASRSTHHESISDYPNNDDILILDGWILLSDGNDRADVWKNVNGGGISGNEDYIRLDVEDVTTGGSGAKFGILQVIEHKHCRDVLDGNGVVSLSFEARVSDITKLSDVRAAVLAWTLPADVVVSDVVSSWNAEGTRPTLIGDWTAENVDSNLNLTTSWVRFKIENIPIDTASAANLAVFIYQNNVATNDTAGVTLDITTVHLNRGAVADVFERQDFATEKAACQRYHETFNEYGTASHSFETGQCISTTQARILFHFTDKRVSPTISHNAAANFQVTKADGTFQAVTVMTFTEIKRTSAVGVVTVAAGLVAGNATRLRDSGAGSGKIYIQSEL